MGKGCSAENTEGNSFLKNTLCQNWKLKRRLYFLFLFPWVTSTEDQLRSTYTEPGRKLIIKCAEVSEASSLTGELSSRRGCHHYQLQTWLKAIEATPPPPTYLAPRDLHYCKQHWGGKNKRETTVLLSRGDASIQESIFQPYIIPAFSLCSYGETQLWPSSIARAPCTAMC